MQARHENKHIDKKCCELRHALRKQQEQAHHSGAPDGKHNGQEYLKRLGVQGQLWLGRPGSPKLPSRDNFNVALALPSVDGEHNPREADLSNFECKCLLTEIDC
jgi:hypothetical protein